MNKATDELPDDGDEPAMVPGRWYMFLSTGGFTNFGQYVRALGLGAHRFRHVTHLRNAGGRSLPELCKLGPGRETKFAAGTYPRFWNGAVHTWVDYTAKVTWVKEPDVE
jgi:hypothetical protein